ncbi:MAG: DUF2513 domain-containing protein [Oscillospiraceae bacterium]|nr:DUF2513 domain-containing protein [Oscillospiraceae bacterium]
MRLNWDCVRDILLCAEEHVDLRTSCEFVDCVLADAAKLPGHDNKIPEYERPLLEAYGNDCLIYHVRYCLEAGLLAEGVNSSPVIYIVSDLTPKGHDFAANIHSDKVWKRFKESTRPSEPISLENIMQCVSSLAAAASAFLG